MDETERRAVAIRLLALDVDGVLSDGRLYYGTKGEEFKAFHTRDGLGIKMLMSTGIEVAIVTARDSTIVSRRAEELGIKHCIQNALDKAAALDRLCTSLDLRREQTAYMGDDLPDIGAMQITGLALTVSDCSATVALYAHWRSSATGGRGAVREACEMIMRAQGTFDAAESRFGVPGPSKLSK